MREERRHEPTEARLREAHRNGDVPISRELGAAGAVTAGLFLVVVLGRPVWDAVAELARRQLHGAGSRESLSAAANPLPDLAPVAAALLPLLLSLLIVGVLASGLQTGFRWMPARLRLDLGRLSPWRPSRPDRLANAAWTVLKATLAVAVALGAAWNMLPQVAGARGGLLSGVALAGAVVGRCLAAVALTLLVLGGLDLLWRRAEHRRRLRMTDAELRQASQDRSASADVARRRLSRIGRDARG